MSGPLTDGSSVPEDPEGIRAMLDVMDQVRRPDDVSEYRIRLRVWDGPPPVVRVRAGNLAEAKLRAFLYFLQAFPWYRPTAEDLVWLM